MNDITQKDTHYRTGTDAAPRHRGGLVAVLLVMVVLLASVITILSLLNIHLFVALQKEDSALRLQSATTGDGTVPSLSEPQLNKNEELFADESDTETRQDVLTPQQIYANCVNWVVSVRCNGVVGTGLVIDECGYIIANHHVVQDLAPIEVRLSDNRQYTARLVAADALSDLAVLHIEADGLTAASFGDSAGLQIGDSVCVIGDPTGDRQNALTNGQVSAIQIGDYPLIQTEGCWNFGGPLIDRFGQVVAINISPVGLDQEGIAIPGDTVKSIAQQLICQGYVSGRPGLGVSCEPVTERYQHLYDLPAGLYVTEILTELADLSLEAGDILLTLDGQPLTTLEELTGALYRFGAGDAVDIEILRDGSRTIVTVTIEESTG